MAERMMLEFAESGHPIFRATSPLSRGRLKSKGHGKLSIHYSADLETIETIFRIIVSAKQLSLYGAVAEMCEEYETFHDRSGQPFVGGQSSSSLVLKRDQDRSAFGFWWLGKQRSSIAAIWRTNWKAITTRQIVHILYGCRISEFCWNRTKFRAVAYRENTLPRDENLSEPKEVGFGWTLRLDPYWKSQLAAYKVNMEWKWELCLWTETILTLGLEFLMDQTSLWWIWTTTGRKFQKFSSKNMRGNWMRRILHVDQRPKQNHKNEILPGLPQEQYLLGKEIGPMLNQGDIHSPIMIYRRNWFIFFVMENKYIEKMMERLNSGESKTIFRHIFLHCHHWSDDKWKMSMAGGGGNKKRCQYCTDSSGIIVYLRALQGHSGCNLVDPTLQDKVII